jgi:hypothetical protein
MALQLADPRTAWKTLTRERVSRTAGRFAIGVVVLGIALMGLANWSSEPTGASWLEATLNDLGALLVVSGTLTVLWELLGRRALTDEVLAAANLSSDVTAANLQRVSTRYLIDAEWNALFSSARNVDLFFAYAQTWRNSHATALRGLVARPDVRLRVVLPDPTEDRLMALLAAKFGYEAADLQTKIQGALRDFENLAQQAHSSASVNVRLTNQFPVYTYYRFDHQALVVLYSQVVGRADMPMFQFEKGGTLYRHFESQFETLWDRSVPSDNEPSIGS